MLWRDTIETLDDSRRILSPNNRHSATRMVFIRKITWQLSLTLTEKA